MIVRDHGGVRVDRRQPLRRRESYLLMRVALRDVPVASSCARLVLTRQVLVVSRLYENIT